MTDKPKITGTSHLLPFAELSPAQFERLCLWLVEREGYLHPEHLGEAGRDQGRDVIAYRVTASGEQLLYFQCKRYQSIGAATLIKEIGKYEKLVAGDSTKKPFGVVFVTNATISADAREEVHKACAKQGYECTFWARTELDMLVKRYDDIVEEFFDLKAATVKNETRIETTGNRNVIIHGPATQVNIYTGDHITTRGSRERKSTAFDLIPRPPAFYAEPAYIGSHNFVGRKAQLDTLNDWASPADSHPVLLFEAIGGNGKSMLTWEWANNHATKLGVDWAGRFWYSFYEKGAVMADFCQRALAYITRKPLKTFQKKKTAELSELLLRHLQDRPWLLILDGLERVLVAYHRIDAAQLMDEKAGTTDEIAHRDPCTAIRPEDDDLLRALAAATPSKILITSRLTPRILLNAANYPIQGVVRERLAGLRPADAEALLRSCGIKGSSQKIRHYLQQHCDCHPLVIGVLAGLIQNYLPRRGDFDAWVDSAMGGEALNLANLTLVQKRNHILEAALKALTGESRQLISTLALLSESADYETLSAFNPYLPAEPEKVAKPEKPEESWRWEEMSDAEKEQVRQYYQAALKRWQQHEAARKQSSEYLEAEQKLADTVRDLESRGLLQYDAQVERYELHPVVCGIAAGGLQQDETERYGQSVVDYFAQKAHNPYEKVRTLDELRDGLQIVRTLLQMGRYEQAYDNYKGDFALALSHNLEAHSKTLSLLRPFFPQGWANLPKRLDENSASYLANYAGISLSEIGELDEALAAFANSLLIDIKRENWIVTQVVLSNIAITFSMQNCLAKAESYLRLALEVVTLRADDAGILLIHLHLFGLLGELGKYEEAEALWQLLDGMERDLPGYRYSQSTAGYWYARWRFWQGDLREVDLTAAEQLARSDRNHQNIRRLYRLRGEWQLERGNWELAAVSLQEAVRMAHVIGLHDAAAETLLALARFHLNQLPDPEQQAEQLAGAKKPFHRGLAELWLQIDNVKHAGKHALDAYKWAWADGEPYVHRYELNQARILLERLGLPIPVLPSYDAANYEKLPWEDELTPAIEKLRAKVKAKLTAKDAPSAGEKE